MDMAKAAAELNVLWHLAHRAGTFLPPAVS
jgi:hypothetical protein